MKITTIIALFVVLLAGSAFVGDKDNGCKLQGTWMGETPYPLPGNPDFILRFMATYHGTGDNEGTEVIHYFNLPTNLPTEAKFGDSRGVWAKTGPNTYDYTLVTVVVDDLGNVVGIARNSGTKKLTNCNSMEATSNIQYLDPETMSPIPGMCFPGTATAQRITLHQPCE
jgi:hypothetical protein